jgi:hypothetical protein
MPTLWTGLATYDNIFWPRNFLLIFSLSLWMVWTYPTPFLLFILWIIASRLIKHFFLLKHVLYASESTYWILRWSEETFTSYKDIFVPPLCYSDCFCFKSCITIERYKFSYYIFVQHWTRQTSFFHNFVYFSFVRYVLFVRGIKRLC